MLNINELVLNDNKSKLSLSEIYRNKQRVEIENRIQNINKRYNEEYNENGKYLNRSPGRVNLIGEHIDYNGYGVLPFAIEKDCIMISGSNEQQIIRISHRDNHKYSNKQIDLKTINDIKDQSHLIKDGIIEYWQYIVAGIKSVLELGYELKKGINIMIDGDIPLGSGLSSSSALTCCGSIVGMTILNEDQSLEIGRNEYILGVIDGERKLGIACGGMDQTISLMGQKDTAMFIHFEPQLGFHNVQISNQVSFIVANSLTESIKSQTSYKQYNMRVVECKVALYLLIQYVNHQQSIQYDYFQITNLADFQSKLNKSIEQMIDLVEECFHNMKQDMTVQQIKQSIGNEIQLEQIVSQVQNHQDVLQKNQLFGIYSRIRHVVNEYKRVRDFIDLCTYKSDCQEQQMIQQMGVLMNQSQQSCRDLYECSSPNIDRLIEIGQEEGVIGGRLTGAGWGGCVIFMVYHSQVEQFIQVLNHQFYSKFDNQQTDCLHSFGCQPTRGAFSILMDNLCFD